MVSSNLSSSISFGMTMPWFRALGYSPTAIGIASRKRAIAIGKSESGQALVEFALVLPVLLLVVMGILWFGRALNYTQDETRLANVAARYASVNQVPPGAGSSLTEWVRSQADSPELRNGTGDVQGPLDVCVRYPAGTDVGDPVEVKVSANFKWLPLLKVGVSSAVSGSATMRIEVPPTNSFFAAVCP